MELEDVTKLLDLLDKLYQGKPRPRDRATVAIWREVLRPWSYAQARTAVIQRARTNRYYPDPSEIAQLCPEIPEPAETSDGADRRAPPGRVETEHTRRSLEWQARWHQELQGFGLPTLHDAVQAGMSVPEWNRMLEETGIWATQTKVSPARSSPGTSG